jgi:hypothetical protein
MAVFVVALAALSLGAARAPAQDFGADWFSIDGGGFIASTGGSFSLSGTIGQPDAGPVMTGGSFQLTGGFWAIGNGLPCGGNCTGDLDQDCSVSLQDLATLLAHFGTPGGATPEDGDLDGNGAVTLQDLAILLASFGTTCP